MQIRIGIADSGREIELEVDDVDALIAEVEQAVGGAATMLWLTDLKGHRFGVPSGQVAYVQIEADERSAVGFGPG